MYRVVYIFEFFCNDFQNTKDRITDLLVDEILEDAVQELERLDNDTMMTRQAQIMHDTPTYENLLQELEYMEASVLFTEILTS